MVFLCTVVDIWRNSDLGLGLVTGVIISANITGDDALDLAQFYVHYGVSPTTAQY